jgi:hypothetical protein
LDEVVAGLATLEQAPSSGITGPALDRAGLEQLLQALAKDLDEFSPDAVEKAQQLLGELRGTAANDAAAEVLRHTGNFEFGEAQTALELLRSQLP